MIIGETRLLFAGLQKILILSLRLAQEIQMQVHNAHTVCTFFRYMYLRPTADSGCG